MSYLASVSLSSWRPDRIAFTLQDSNGDALEVYFYALYRGALGEYDIPRTDIPDLQLGEADPAGLDYWQGELARGGSRENILLSFSESAENQANVISLIADGIRYESWDPIAV